ncbi:MAG: hypothetical protein NWR72_02825 [Bacteroidia bacterium]|nr:hypothetical protein [Bacteroidia bacterium]
MIRYTLISAFAFALMLVGFSTQSQAQKISLTANFSSFDLDRVSSGNTTIDYAGSSTVGLNLRYYTKKKWAIRAGAGIDNLQYTVGNSLQTDYSARRQDITGVLGLEKHLMLGPLDIYPGVFVPVVVVGDDNILDANYDNITNGNLRAGVGLLMGANIKFLKILRLGVEFDATYDNFKTGVYDGVSQASFVPVKGINHNVSFTLGIAL